MPRGERPLSSQDTALLRFAADLRQLREKAGSPTYRQLARLAHYSPAALSDAVAGRKLPTLAVTLAYVRGCDGDTEEWQARWQELASGEAAPAPAQDDAPYAGLAAFRAEDADRFFGRERIVQTLLRRVGDRRLTGLFGASGSGKTSVLHAGLVAALTGAGQPVLVFTPGPHPLEECAVALAAFAGEPAAELHTEFAADPVNLHLRIRQVLAAQSQETDLVLVVDQFEEVFTLCQDPVERSAFVAALVAATRSATSRARVVLGARADFLGHVGQYPELVEALAEGQLLLGAMAPEELRQAISQPAVRAGCQVESALVARIMADAAAQPAVLPMVSHALVETWRRRQGIALTVAGYEAAGGIHHAIARTTEDTYRGFSARQQEIARGLFLRLIALGEGTEDTARRVRTEELDLADPGTRQVLDALVSARLLTVDQHSVQVAHEALIRCWPRLRDWLAADREALRVHRQLTEATQIWESLRHDPGVLFRGTRLARARDWSQAHGSELTARERAFLDASLAAEADELFHSRRRTRRLRQLVSLLSVLLVVAVVSVVGFVHMQDANTRQRDQALVQGALSEANAQRASNPALAAQLAVAAYRIEDSARTRSGVLNALAQPYASRLTDHNAPVRAVAFNPHGHQLATAGGDRTVRLRDVGDPHHPRTTATVTGAGTAGSLAYSHSGRLLAMSHNDGTASLLDVTDPSAPRTVFAAPTPAEAAGAYIRLASEFSPDDRTLAATSSGNTVRLWDVSDPTAIKPLSEISASYNAVAFSRDGHLLITAGMGSVTAWDVSDLRHPVEVGTIEAGSGPVMSIAFSPFGRLLLVAASDNTARLVDVSDPRHARQVSLLAGHSGVITSAAFGPDGRTVATGGVDLTTRWWDVSDPAHPAVITVLPGHSAPITTVVFSPNGRELATGAEDGIVTVQDLPQSARQHGAQGMNFGSVDASGRLLATRASGGTALWDLGKPDAGGPVGVVPGGGAAVSAEFAQVGHLLVSSFEDKSVSLWDVADPRAPRRLGSLPGGSAEVPFLRLSRDGRVLVTTVDSRTIRLWDLSDPGKPVQRAELTDALAPALSSDGRTLATQSSSGESKLWDISSLDRPQPLASFASKLAESPRSFSTDGRLLAIGRFTDSGDFVTLWDISDRSHPRELGSVPTPNGALAITFSQDDRRLAVSTLGGGLHLFDLADPSSPAPVADLLADTSTLTSVTFAADGRTVVSVDFDNVTRLWDTDPHAAVAQICAVAWPVISEQEWGRYFPGLAYSPPCG
ncbi:hypothetical protein GCM10010174_40600 [Kutzneria viridogrisea]|uniref:WD40 repeat protein n=1 Tax=Kutzneria viridogrisea TaxID=47990 RepID=A0ABR6BN57_9PSEU|nr:WD40 repeat protein [Kutzneria viridogrisea]